MRTSAVIAAVIAALGVAGPAAWAEDIVAYQADGDADAAAPDARVAALDEAFGRAVSQALADLVAPEVRRQNKPVLDRELLGHARLWVARFTVTREVVADDRRQLSVAVRIDRDKLRARLAELDIATRDAGEPAAASAPSVTVLLRVATPEGVHATYGAGAEKEVAGGAALSDALRRANLVVRRAPASGPASGPAARRDGELPLKDDAAEALASEAGAELAAIAGVTVGAPVPLRGLAADGVLITAHVRLIDRKAHRLIGQGAAFGAARGVDPGVVGRVIDRAIDRVLRGAAADILPEPAPGVAPAQAGGGDDAPLGEPGIVLVRLARTTPWAMVQAELKHLTGTRGVARATLRRVSPSGWVIGVATGESVDRIASVVKKPPAADVAMSVRVVGDLVEAAMSGGS